MDLISAHCSNKYFMTDYHSQRSYLAPGSSSSSSSDSDLDLDLDPSLFVNDPFDHDSDEDLENFCLYPNETFPDFYPDILITESDIEHYI